jgi:hypothetical protein
VRDIALAHVLCVELPAASVAGKRLFIVADKFCNRDIVDVIAEKLLGLGDRLPTGKVLKLGMFPERGVHGFDNSRSREVLELRYRGFEESVVDAARSLLAVEEREREGKDEE